MVKDLVEVVVSLGLGVHSVRLGLVDTQVSLGLRPVADSWGCLRWGSPGEQGTVRLGL